MSTSSPPPNPQGPAQPEPGRESAGASRQAAVPLSAHERELLSRLAARERATDPRFADDLAAGRVRDPGGPAPRWVAIVGALLVVAVVAGFVAGPWFPLGALLAFVVAVPLALAFWASRQERSRP